MSKTTKIVLFTVIALFILGMALYPTLSKYFNKADEIEGTSPPVSSSRSGRAPLNVEIKVITPEVLIDQIYTKGSFIPDEEVALAFESSGKVTDIFFQEGSFVKKGNLLAKVNDKPLQAELKKLEAQIPLAEDRVFRQSALLEKDAVSKEAYEQVTTELEKLHADIELAKARLAQTELRAPFDGMIGLRQVSEGSYVATSTIVATLTRISPLKIEFSINEKDVNDVKPGTTISFTNINDLNTYYAKVYAVESRIDMKTKTLSVRATYPNTHGRLKPGGSTDITINKNEINDAFTVPNEAIIAEMGRDILYLYSDGKAKQIEVSKGMRLEDKIQILTGIQEGDTVITTGVMQLRDGLPVSIIE